MSAVVVLRSNAQGGARVQPGFVEVFERAGVLSDQRLSNVRARAVNSRGARRWRFEIESGYGQYVSVLHAWDVACGPNQRMAFTPEGAADVDAFDVCFVADSLETRRTGPRTWQISFEIEEAR